jgi:hypothetical protein
MIVNRKFEVICDRYKINKGKVICMQFNELKFPIRSQLSFNTLDDGASHEISCLQTSVDGRWIAAVCQQEARVWSVPSGDLVLELTEVGGLIFTKNNELVVSISDIVNERDYYKIVIYRLPIREKIREIPSQPNSINILNINQNDSLLVSGELGHDCSWGGFIQIRDFKTGCIFSLFKAHQRLIQHIRFNSAGNLIVTRSFGEIGLWTLNGEKICSLNNQVDGFGGIAISNNDIIAISCRDQIKLADFTGKQLNTICANEYIWSLAFSKDGTYLAAGTTKGTIALWEMKHFEYITTLKCPESGIKHVEWLPDNTLLAAAGDNLFIWGEYQIGEPSPRKAAARTDDGDLDERLERISQKIIERGLMMNPVLELTTLEAFEQKYRIALPAGYRRFLLEIGNGGDGIGPDGLIQLGQIPEGYYHQGDPLERACKPFPLLKEWIWEGADEEPDPEKLEMVEDGWIFLGDMGCGQYWIMIVAGQARGQVWNYADVGIGPCNPARDFLSWYEYWLDGGKT